MSYKVIILHFVVETSAFLHPMVMKTLIVLVLLSISTSFLHAQSHSITEMHKFMQVNADTTIVLSYSSNWISSNRYMLFSRKGDTLTCYQHKPIDDISVLSRVKIPSAIRKNVFYKRLNEPVDVHGEFHLVDLKEETLGLLWRRLQRLNLWSLADDSVDGQHCPPPPPGDVAIDNRIIDSSTIHLDLITRDSIKALAFYDPFNYEKICPSRPGRLTILELEKLFLTHVK